MSMKRKAGAGALATASPAQKRSRKDGDPSQDVTKKGLEFLDALRETRDKSGRAVAARFEKLPDKKKEAAWYEQVSMPLSLEIIQKKLEQGKYPTMTTLESDLKRMVFNWKGVYDRASEPHKDAEKVRKIVTLHMKDKKLNPQYELDPDYVSFPTELPDELEQEDYDMEDSVNVATPAKDIKPRGRIILRQSSQKVPVAPESDEDAPTDKAAPRLRLRFPRRSNVEAETAVTDGEGNDEGASPPPPKRGRIILRRLSGPSTEANKSRKRSPSYKLPEAASEGFEGKSMTEAQEKIIDEMMELEDEGGNSISGPFVHLPPRDLKDYYALIKHPLSIKGAQKLVRGIRGRDKSGKTFLETWQEFDDEISHIWDNARIYNEDDSEISKLAGKLENYFKMRLEIAKKAVPDPVAPKLKLSVGKTAESSGKPTVEVGTPHQMTNGQASNYSIDEDALKRQKQLVANGIGGRRSTGPASASPAPQATTPGESATHKASTGSPGLTGSGDTPQPNSGMLPPSTTPRPQPTVVRPPPPPAPEETKKPWDTWKRSDRSEQFRWPYATIKEILIISHPSLNLGDNAYKWSLYPRPDFNYASDTMPMHSEVNRILLSPLFINRSRERPQVQHLVTLDGVLLQASPSASRIPGSQFSDEENLYRPVYDITLNSNDINEIMVECFTCPSEVSETKDVIHDKHMINIQPRLQ